MNNCIQTYPRSPMAAGVDCTVAFLKRVDNIKALVDVWQIIMAGQTFELQLMRMRYKSNTHPWVFGSITIPSSKKLVWSFRWDDRVANRDFIGDVFTTVGADSLTYVSYQTFGQEKYRVLLSELLQVEQPTRVTPLLMTVVTDMSVTSTEISPRTVRWQRSTAPVDTSSEMLYFVDEVLRWM